MSTPTPDPNEPSKFKRILSANANLDETIRVRLPRGNGVRPSVPASPLEATAAVPAVQPVDNNAPRPRRRLLEAFWTIASLVSITVNIVLVAILLILLNMLAGVQLTANDQVSGLLGGLYSNFVKMDQATISRTIPVNANIPLNFTVPVDRSEPTGLETEIKLSREAIIENAHVTITEGGVNIDADAIVRLPPQTTLTVYISRFEIPVQNSVPVQLDVPINIPLNETELHDAFF